MAYDRATNGLPNDLIPGFSSDGTDITIPIASIPELVASEADGTTGDYRKVLSALLKAIYDMWNAIAAADRPANVTIYLSTSVNDITGAVTRSFTFQFVGSSGAFEVANES